MTPKQRKEARQRWIRNATADAWVYIGCFGGVILTKLIPDLKSGATTVMLPTTTSLITSAAVALVVVMIEEARATKTSKRQAIGRRVRSAFLWGVFAIEILEKFL